jgi:hypothetical protein
VNKGSHIDIYNTDRESKPLQLSMGLTVAIVLLMTVAAGLAFGWLVVWIVRAI